MSRMTFVNLPVQDLRRAVDFWRGLGFAFNRQFTDDNATCMVISDQACVMLLVEKFFSTFTTRDITDTTTHAEVIMALSAESREDVDTLVDKALATGGSPANDPQEEEFMYSRSFHDPDGHLWELVYMDPAALEQQG
jgi:predicted lactoylglutathione lyase